MFTQHSDYRFGRVRMSVLVNWSVYSFDRIFGSSFSDGHSHSYVEDEYDDHGQKKKQKTRDLTDGPVGRNIGSHHGAVTGFWNFLTGTWKPTRFFIHVCYRSAIKALIIKADWSDCFYLRANSILVYSTIVTIQFNSIFDLNLNSEEGEKK